MNELEAQPPAVTTAPAPVPAVATPTIGQTPAPAKLQQTTTTPPASWPEAEKLSHKPAKGTLAFPPIKGPPPAVSADKEARLAELLRMYKADVITPEQYHQQRAKILSEP